MQTESPEPSSRLCRACSALRLPELCATSILQRASVRSGVARKGKSRSRLALRANPISVPRQGGLRRPSQRPLHISALTVFALNQSTFAMQMFASIHSNTLFFVREKSLDAILQGYNSNLRGTNCGRLISNAKNCTTCCTLHGNMCKYLTYHFQCCFFWHVPYVPASNPYK